MIKPNLSISFSPVDFKAQVEDELRRNILPFWIKNTVDPVNGGFYGALTNTLEIHNEMPRSAILCARILWTYATAYRIYREEAYLGMAARAYHYLTNQFWDSDSHGIYWTVDSNGQSTNSRKHSYAQAFAIYGLAEYYRATHDEESLRLAKELFALLESHAHDDLYGGYIEGCSQVWGHLSDMRLSDKEINCQKSMNTLLHLLEAFTNLLQVWDNPLLRTRLKELIELFIDRVINPRTYHFQLFFDQQWHSLRLQDSYGHDIEGSWLLVEAAEILGEPSLIQQTREIAPKMADVTIREALAPDGGVYYECAGPGPVDRARHWWVQTEAVVGFYNAYQISRLPGYAEASFRTWKFIQDKFVDRVNGDWFKILDQDGNPLENQFKTGPWECPYHHSRACFEIIRRIPD
jgi:mannobiose 2-epimerase